MTGSSLTLLVNADLDLCLLTLGILLLYLEFNVPGTVIPGAAGMLLLSLGLYGLSHLPLHPAAILMALLGLILLLLELRYPRRNLLAIAGIAILSTGLARLVEAPASPHLVTAVATGALFGIATLALGRVAVQARRNKAIR